MNENIDTINTERKIKSIDLAMKILDNDFSDPSLDGSGNLNLKKSQKQMFFIRLFNNVVNKVNE